MPKGLLELEFIGTIQAGWPSPAEEETVDLMRLDEWLIRNRDATYLIKVHGPSMNGAGIMPGDAVLVDRSLTAVDGDIVIAEIDGAFTMKYLRKKGDRVWLEAANPKFPPIYPKQELVITAVVIANLRKYK